MFRTSRSVLDKLTSLAITADRDRDRDARVALRPWRRGVVGVIASSVALLFSCFAGVAHAQVGINLSWDDCGTFGVASKAFACNSNEGFNTLVASFVAPPDVWPDHIIAVLDLQTSGAVLPDWWQFKNSGACRLSALRASTLFLGEPFNCHDYWGGGGTPGINAYEPGFGSPNRARLKVSVSSAFEPSLPPSGTENYAFKLILSNENSVGKGACPGCQDGACIVLNSMELVQPVGLPRPVLTAPISRNHVTWQAGIPNCPGATPIRNATWGLLKASYR